MKSYFQLVLLLSVLSLSFCSTAFAQKDSSSKLSSAEERSAIEFAQEHHRELAVLLQQLKEMDFDKYRSAIQELSNTNERLEKLRARSPERFQTELNLWEIDSRVRLLVARSVGGMEDQTREAIKKLLLKRNQIRLDQYNLERERLLVRLNRLDDHISQLADGETLAEQDFDRLVNSAARLSAKRKNTNTKSSGLPTTRKSEPTKATTKNKTKPTVSNTQIKN